MKSLKFSLACAFVSSLLAGIAWAADDAQAKDQDKPKDQAACTCAKDKDGKACGLEKDCCCTGAKATCKDTAKTDTQKQQDQPKDDAKK
jgi:hypothetical protein